VAPCAIFFAAFQGWPAIVFFWFEQATMKAGWWAWLKLLKLCENEGPSNIGQPSLRLRTLG